ncbi:MAG: CARDB domain-containing protein, partial [Candidatus Nanosalina sp.]
VDVPDTYNLTAGAEGTIQATVRNSGKLFITSMNVSITDSAISSGTETVTNLASGDSVPVNFQISTNASDVGRKELTVSTDQPSASAAVTVFVKANQDQRERVKRLLSNYSSRLENLQNNISDLRSSGLPEEMNKTLSSNVSDFRESVKRSEQYVSEGKYFKALSELEGVSEDYATASSTFTQIKNSYQVRQRNRMIITALVVLLIGVVAAGVHFFRKGELSIDLTEDDIPGLVEAQEILREKFEDLKEFVEKEEEEAEKKFEGFK